MITDSASLIPELERVIQQGSADKCAEMLSGITSLFLSGAGQFNEDHVALFDAVFARLIDDIETRARAELSERLAPVENAPPKLVRRLANDDDISVAAPMLELSPRLVDADLRDIAGSKGQQHLLAISVRQAISEAVTDVLVQRGDRDVIKTVVDNQGARLSEKGFSTLVERAADDGVLAEKVGQREDIPPRLFRTLLFQATEVVQQRLLTKARPETAAEIRRVLAKVSEEIGAKAPAPRDYTEAKAAVIALKQQAKLGEPSLLSFAKDGHFEETVAALAALTSVPVETVERLMAGDRPDPVLILCKGAGFGWQTVRAIILVRPGVKGKSNQSIEAAYANFERLSPSTAQRVTRFWQAQPGNNAA
jgi:uncharacterized protein (DUF2336 family)